MRGSGSGVCAQLGRSEPKPLWSWRVLFFLQDGVGETAFSSESFNTYKLLLYWLKKNLDTIFFVVFS